MNTKKSSGGTNKKAPSNTRRKPSKPWDTVLKPYLAEIDDMRRRRPPLSLRKIAAELFCKHGLQVSHSTIGSVIHAREVERKVKPIHQSFLVPVAPQRPSNDAVERLRRKAAAKPQQGSDPWDELEIKGPLSK